MSSMNLFPYRADAGSVGLGAIIDKGKGYGESLGGRHWELSPPLARLAAECGTPSAFKG